MNSITLEFLSVSFTFSIVAPVGLASYTIHLFALFICASSYITYSGVTFTGNSVVVSISSILPLPIIEKALTEIIELSDSNSFKSASKSLWNVCHCPFIASSPSPCLI